MIWTHPDHAGRAVRLAYCLNLHGADDLTGTRRGIESITFALKQRIAPAASFGAGLYLPANVARELASDADTCRTFGAFLREHGLDPFTFNAFPYGGFHREGLKADVYKPTWLEEERVRFTSDVAHVAALLNVRTRAADASERSSAHVSISTHPGAFGVWITSEAERATCARNMARALAVFARLEAQGAPRMILSIEAEPRASAGDGAELAAYFELLRQVAPDVLVAELGCTQAAARDLVRRHAGVCLDACHSAVEFEDAPLALERAQADTLGKIQFSSALTVTDPAAEPARAALLGLDEPVYLHQVSAQSAGGALLQVGDLPELAAALTARPEPWFQASEWRCHFHVPVDLAAVGGLGTTPAHADTILRAALAAPERWSTPELHVEIETYTWDVLPGSARGTGDLVDGLEREYAHVIALLTAAGWQPARSA